LSDPSEVTTAPSDDTTPVSGRSTDPLLAVTADGTVLRVTRGSCGDDNRPVVDVSGKRGRSITSGTIDGLSEALRVYASNDVLTVVGLDADRAVTTYTSSDRGAKWSSTPGADGTW
jgi:hypothetical protein